MIETQASISKWATDTFGESGTLFRIATRANEEMAEAMRASATDGDIGEITVEIADVMIVLCRLGEQLNQDLSISEQEKVSFDPSEDIWSAVAVANRDMSKLCLSIAQGQRDRAKAELVYCWLKLKAIIRFAGGIPQEVIDAKMAINRGRIWHKDGTGHGYHIRASEVTQ